MKNTISRRDRRVLRRAQHDQADATPDSPPDASSSPEQPHRPPGKARFDAAAVAADVAAQWIGADGRRRCMATASGLLAPVLPSGRWLPVDDRDLVLELQLASVARGHRLLLPRLDAARAELRTLLWDDGPELWPHVDAEALCRPARRHGPPANWTGAGDGRAWVAEHTYGAAGRCVAIWSGSAYIWLDDAWRQCEGSDEWLGELIDPAGDRRPDAGLIDEVRRALAVPFVPADPGAVAAHDHQRAVAEVVANERRVIDGRRRPRTSTTSINWRG